MQLREMVNFGSAVSAVPHFYKIRMLRAEVRESYRGLKPRNRCGEQMPQVIWMLGQVWKPLHSANSVLSVVNALKTGSFQSNININTSLPESNESINPWTFRQVSISSYGSCGSWETFPTWSALELSVINCVFAVSAGRVWMLNGQWLHSCWHTVGFKAEYFVTHLALSFGKHGWSWLIIGFIVQILDSENTRDRGRC